MDTTTVQTVAYIAAGATIGSALAVPILKFLARSWLKQRESFEQDIAEKLGLLNQALGAAKDQLTGTIVAVREEARDGREALLAHVDREDAMIRERSHQLGGALGVLTNKVEVASLDVREAIQANKETLAFCQEKYGGVVEDIHRLAVEIAARK